MITSMTAFAKAERTGDRFSLTIEIRTYNHKYLDIALKLPRGYDVLEEKVRAIIKKTVARGRVEVKIRVQQDAEATSAYTVNEPQAKAYFNALVQLKDLLGIEGDINLDNLVACNGLIVPVEDVLDLDTVWIDLEAGLNESLDALIAMRTREGAYIERDFVDRLNDIETNLTSIATAAADLPALYQQRLKDRIGVLTKGLVEIDDGRIAQEAAFLADRSDISEEIVRASSHIEQFRAIMAAPEPGGRKLNFLLQELNREVNTMGSKTGHTEMAHTIVTVKSELEKIREQVQNIE
jgi:uncharacterized protein (TIGR00255 family)